MSYRQEVLNDNPLGYWPMNDAVGATTMTAVVGANGTYTNGPVLGSTPALATATDTSAKFDGSNDFASVAIDLSGQSHITVEFWLYWAASADDDKLAMEYTPNQNSNKGFLVDPNSSQTTGTSRVEFSNGDSTNYWTDRWTRPSINTWHHWVIDYDRANHVNIVYIDTLSQTLTAAPLHSNVSYGNFANSTLYLMSRGGTTLYCPANSMMAHVAIYSGGLSASRIGVHYTAGAAPLALNNYQFVRADSGISVTEKIR